MKIYGFDVDGVISKIPLDLRKKRDQAIHRFIVCRLFEIKIIWRLYNRWARTANPEIKKVIKELKKKGHKIILITGNPEWRRPELADWFAREKIPYDKLILAPSVNTRVRPWKAKTIEKEQCDYYLEDHPKIVAAIKKVARANKSKFRVLCYRNQTAEEILKVLKP